jgi:hypothetical protein
MAAPTCGKGPTGAVLRFWRMDSRLRIRSFMAVGDERWVQGPANRALEMLAGAVVIPPAQVCAGRRSVHSRAGWCCLMGFGPAGLSTLRRWICVRRSALGPLPPFRSAARKPPLTCCSGCRKSRCLPTASYSLLT